MKPSSLTSLLIIFGSLSFHFCWAQESPRAIVEKIFSQVKTKEFQTNNKAQKEITDMFDYLLMTQKILGPSELKKHPATEVEWVSNHIKQIVSLTVYPKSHDFLKDVSLKHQALTNKKNKASILTIIKKRGEETEVETVFQQSGSTWKIIDISIDDESWVDNIQQQVKDTLAKKNWIGLKKSLSERLEKLQKEDKQQNNKHYNKEDNKVTIND